MADEKTFNLLCLVRALLGRSQPVAGMPWVAQKGASRIQTDHQ